MPVLNRLDLTKDCLKSISEKTHNSYKIILIDNGSAEDTKIFLENFKSSNKDVVLVRNEDNLGWVKAVNQGLHLSVDPYVCVMNNDVIVKTDDWLAKLIRVADLEPDIGLVNPGFDVKKKLSQEGPFIEVDFCRGYCMLIKRAVIERIGTLDEAYGLGYYDDDDYSVRAIRAGFRCVRANDVIVEHLRDSTFSSLFTDEKRRILHENNKKLFYSKWGKRLKLVFIITKDVSEEHISGLLFSLARKQHIIHLWIFAKPPLLLQHINIRELNFPRLFGNLLFFLALYINKIKKRDKRYDIIFTDNPGLSLVLSGHGYPVYYVGIEKDKYKINEIANFEAKA